MRLVGAFVVASLLGPLPAAAVASATELVGHWRLVEQHYERGGHNLVPHTETHHIEIRPSLDGEAVRTWTGPSADLAVRWPAVLVDGRTVEIETHERTVDLEHGVLRATYRVDPGVEGGQIIDVVEEYRLDEEADSLVGTITFRMTRGGEPRGGYVLRRRYERTP
jgi:hypothetical protein